MKTKNLKRRLLKIKPKRRVDLCSKDKESTYCLMILQGSSHLKTFLTLLPQVISYQNKGLLLRKVLKLRLKWRSKQSPKLANLHQRKSPDLFKNHVTMYDWYFVVVDYTSFVKLITNLVQKEDKRVY